MSVQRPGVIGIFHWHNPSGRTMALGLTQPLIEMSTRHISWRGKGGRCVGLTTLPLSCTDCLQNLGASTSWNPQGLPRPVMEFLYLLQRPGTLVCKTRLFFTGKVRYVGIVYVVSIVQHLYFQITFMYHKIWYNVSVCIKHASVLFQPLIMEVWIWSQVSVCGIYGGQSGTGSGSS